MRKVKLSTLDSRRTKVLVLESWLGYSIKPISIVSHCHPEIKACLACQEYYVRYVVRFKHRLE